MDLHDFTQRLKVLRSIDSDDLTDVGIILGMGAWASFREDPLRFLIHAEGHVADKLWALVESRCKPAEPKDAPHALDGLLEPVTKNAAGLGVKSVTEGAVLSAAISLKRMADVLTQNMGDEARNEYGETPIQAIGAGIARALR